jgi:hypothetical protein
MKKLLAIAVFGICFAGCQGDYYHSNRCVTRDTNHTFTRAVIRYSVTDVVVEDVIAWKDYNNSDSIQLWVKDRKSVNGVKVIYTHLSNVILENPQPEFLPKFNKIF